MPIPARIVQTHRSETLAEASRQTWLVHNPHCAYVFYDDAASRQLIAQRCPDLLSAYDRLPLPVQKADMFRYAAIYMDGGVYADTDTRCCAPLESYVNSASDALVVGVEMSPDQYRDGMAAYLPDYPFPHQFAQWTFAASPQHPALAVMLKRIAWHVSLLSDAQLADGSGHMAFTLQLTGPLLFTQVCNEFLSGTRDGALAVLPRMAWGSWLFEQDRADLRQHIKVMHLYEGSWKSARDLPKRAVANSPPAGLHYRFKL